jgi:nucleotide-binding universal stress UspA family protein
MAHSLPDSSGVWHSIAWCLERRARKISSPIPVSSPMKTSCMPGHRGALSTSLGPRDLATSAFISYTSAITVELLTTMSKALETLCAFSNEQPITSGHRNRNQRSAALNILVGVDLSDSTDKVVSYAEKTANALCSKLWILHVAEPEPDFVGYEAGPQSVRDFISKKFHKEHRQIQGIAEKLRKGGVETTAVLVQGSTDETIVNEASKLAADMIVLGSHGRGSIHDLFVGSVSKGVLKKSGCPVLIVPTH